ncbi:hypothetical protein DSECCO2_120080 [anaerobic digester metagenome]
MKKAKYKDGIVTYEVMTQQEIDELIASMPVNVWHDTDCENRFFITNEDCANLLMSQKGNGINNSIINGNLTVVDENGGKLIYYNNISTSSYNTLVEYNAQFETNPDYEKSGTKGKDIR